MPSTATALPKLHYTPMNPAVPTMLGRSTCLAILLICAASVRALSADEEGPVWRIGATAAVVEVTSGLLFPARVDTGATTCSIHCEAIDIKNEADDPKENVGKSARVLIKNPDGDEHWVKTKIADHVVVRTAAREDERYKVALKLRWQEVEKKVLVTLNDRERMTYPLLLGRNFLRNDFLVDVTLDNDESTSSNRSVPEVPQESP